MSSFGDRIRKVIERAGLTPAQAAFDLDWKIQTLSNYMNDKRTVGIDKVIELNNLVSRYIGDQSSYLLTGAEDKNTKQVDKEIYIERTEVNKLLKEYLLELDEIGMIKFRPGVKMSDFTKGFSEVISPSQPSKAPIKNSK